MIKEQANTSASPAAIIELTDEELASMYGGCHNDDDSAKQRADLEKSLRGFEIKDGGWWDGGTLFSFQGVEGSWDNRW